MQKIIKTKKDENCRNGRVSVETVESYPQNVDNYLKIVENLKKLLTQYICKEYMFVTT